MPKYNPEDYETVDERLHKFWEQHPDGRVETEIVTATERQFVVKASVYRHIDAPTPAANGYAEEIVGSSHVNQDSALENCETSAIGRALANLGFSPKGARPSREEMEKSERVKARLDVDAYETLATAMKAAPTLEALEQAGVSAKAYEMHPDDRRALRELYLARKHELEGVTA